jgi:ATP-dependent DNA helicase RecG
MILQYVRAHGSITRRDVVGLCRVSGNQASYLLSKLAERGVLHLVGKGRGAHYELGKTRNKGGKRLFAVRDRHWAG